MHNDVVFTVILEMVLAAGSNVQGMELGGLTDCKLACAKLQS